MHCLIYLRPPKKVLDCLVKEPSEHVYPPPSGYHITLWRFTPHDGDMGKVRETLQKIAQRGKKFTLEIESLVSLGRDGKKAWALQTTRPVPLWHLHGNLLSSLRSLDRNPDLFTEMARDIGGNWYIPHISLNRGEHKPNLSHSYAGVKMRMSSFSLKTKECLRDFWKHDSVYRLH